MNPSIQEEHEDMPSFKAERPYDPAAPRRAYLQTGGYRINPDGSITTPAGAAAERELVAGQRSAP